MLDQINWELFVKDEELQLKKMYQRGDLKGLTSAIEEMTPYKEVEIQKIHDIIEPIANNYKSKVQTDYEKTNPSGPQTPEEEAKLQSQMNNEFADYREKVETKNKKRLEKLDKKSKKETEAEKKEAKKEADEETRAKKEQEDIEKEKVEKEAEEEARIKLRTKEKEAEKAEITEKAEKKVKADIKKDK